MPDLTTYNSRIFNKNLLNFRIKYYLHETGESLLRHKILLVFLLCLLMPGFQNIHLIGVPLSAILDPSLSFTIKCFSLFSLLAILTILIRSQSKPIKGGELRDYLFTLSIPSSIDKKVDLIVLTISMNIVWLAFFFGATGLSAISADNLLLYSYYALYLAMIVTIIGFLLNLLYKNIVNMLILTILLILVAIASIEQNWMLNFGLALFCGLFSSIVTYRVQPIKQKAQTVNSNRLELNGFINNTFLKLYSPILLATIRSYKTAFICRISLCVLLTIILMNLLFADVSFENVFFIFLILISLQSYTISTLSTIFSKNELNYSLFHSIFQYNFFINRCIEVVCMIEVFILSLTPLLIFSAFIKTAYFSLVVVMILANIATIITNRMLYIFSFRFCFFTSLINTVANVVMQYLLIGAFLGK